MHATTTKVIVVGRIVARQKPAICKNRVCCLFSTASASQQQQQQPLLHPSPRVGNSSKRTNTRARSASALQQRGSVQNNNKNTSSTLQKNKDAVPFQLIPGAGPNVSSLSDSAILNLLQQYPKAGIRDTLHRARVFVEWKRRVWRADGVMHSFRRIGGLNTSGMNEPDIHKQLERYVEAKRLQLYRDKVSILEQLAANGIYIHDKRNTWRADGYKHGWEHVRQDHDNNTIALVNADEINSLLDDLVTAQKQLATGNRHLLIETRRRLRAAHVVMDEEAQTWRVQHWRQIGGPNRSGLTNIQIQHQLQHQWGALHKTDKDDQLLLLELARQGVSANERKKTWRADGHVHGYEQIGGGATTTTDQQSTTTNNNNVLVNEIELLLDTVADGQRTEDRKMIAEARRRLEALNVIVDEQRKTWRVLEPPGPVFTGVNTSIYANDEIVELLSQRKTAKRNGNSKLANAIRIQMLKGGVYVDTNKQLRADGRFRQVDNAGPNGSSLTDDEIAEKLQAMVVARFHRADKTANAIWNELFDAGVYIDDTNKQWRADKQQPFFTLVADSGPKVSSLPDERIHTLLATFARAKLVQKHDEAHTILEELYQNDVFINTSKREYRLDGVMHDYKLNLTGIDKVRFTEPQIHQLLGQRIMALKRALSRHGSFEELDIVTQQLERAGVVLNDQEKTCAIQTSLLFQSPAERILCNFFATRTKVELSVMVPLQSKCQSIEPGAPNQTDAPQADVMVATVSTENEDSEAPLPKTGGRFSRILQVAGMKIRSDYLLERAARPVGDVKSSNGNQAATVSTEKSPATVQEMNEQPTDRDDDDSSNPSEGRFKRILTKSLVQSTK
jgi:hypothetical protein